MSVCNWMCLTDDMTIGHSEWSVGRLAAEEGTSDSDLEKPEQEDQSERCVSLGLKRSGSVMNLVEYGGITMSLLLTLA